MMRVVYMAHPVSGDVEGNLAKARILVRQLEEKHPDVAIVASWITECEIWDDADPEQRAAGMRRDMAVVAKCDELWLVGPHVSSGMALEEDHANSLGIPVRDMTGPQL
jgi:predicted amidohydrolase